jgi:hypothetical protein
LKPAYNENDGQVFEDCIDWYTQKLLSNVVNIWYTKLPYSKPTKLFEPVYMTLTSRKLMGNHALASSMSNALNEMIPSFFTVATQATHTRDWRHSNRKFIEKFAPETTNCDFTSPN